MQQITMKQSLFLFCILSSIYVIKAGPLRLQKRAAFYIANETACVVDNIVYTNGDPIPTDDPCEACKCRPPGFACVLKECKPKYGCRAVRHVEECCPEYVCGCEHNGRMYRDGDEIRDEKNPCYECHCQGSSIACAFVDCFYRIDCIPVYVPGECCPHHKNCTKDAPERTSIIGDNALPPANLLPDLYGESVLPNESYATEVPDPPQPPINDDKSEETPVPDDTQSLHKTIETQPLESEVTIVETKPEIGEETDSEKIIKAIPNDEEKDTNAKEEKESVEEIKTLFNSETELKEEESLDVTITEETTEDKTDKNSIGHTESVPEAREEEIQTTLANKIETIENEAEETTEKYVEVVSVSTEVLVTEKPVQNSAADNSKSLKLAEESKSTNEETPVKDEVVGTHDQEDKTEIPVTTEKLSTVVSIESEETHSTESKSETEENIAEESVADPKSVAFYSDDKVIKKESAETVTIVVHVREKTNPPTETDFSTTESSTSAVSEESLLKSNDKLDNIEVIKESSEEAASTGINFEVFPTTAEAKDKSTTSSPEHAEKNIEARSETVSENLEIEEKLTTGESVDKSVPVTTVSVREEVAEISKEETADILISDKIKDETKPSEVSEEALKVPEETEKEIKLTEEPTQEPKLEEQSEETKEIEIKDSNVTLKSGTISDLENTSKIEEPEKESEAVQNKPVEIEETKLEDKSVNAETANTEEKTTSEDTSEVEVDESKAEVRSEESEEKLEEFKLKENIEKADSEVEVQESNPGENAEQDKSTEKVQESKPEENSEEAKSEERSEESEEKVEEPKPEENIEELKLDDPEVKEAEPEKKAEESATHSESAELGEKQVDTLPENTKDHEQKESNQSEEIKDQEPKEPEETNQPEKSKDSE